MDKWKPIRVRLRRGKDDDIAEALKKAAYTEDRSDIVRKALRQHLLRNKTSRPPIEEEVISDVDLKQKEKSDDEVDVAIDDLFNQF